MGQLAGKIKIILIDSWSQYFLKNIILQTQKKNAKCIISYYNNKCILVLVIYMFVMFYFFSSKSRK